MQRQKLYFLLLISISLFFNPKVYSQKINTYLIDPETCPYANSNKGYKLYDFRYIGSGKVCFRHNYVKSNKCAVTVYDLKTKKWKPVIYANGKFLNYCSNGSDFVFATNDKIIQVKVEGKKSTIKILSTGQFKSFSLLESPNWLLVFNKNNRLFSLYETKLNKKSLVQNFELPNYYSLKNLHLLPNKTIIGPMKLRTPSSLQTLWIKLPTNKHLKEVYLNLPLYNYDAEKNAYNPLSNIQIIYSDLQCQQLLLQTNYKNSTSKILSTLTDQPFINYQEFFDSQIPSNNICNQNKETANTNKLLNINRNIYIVRINEENQFALYDLGKCASTAPINAPRIIRNKFPLFALKDECYFFSEQNEKNKLIKRKISEIVKSSDLEEINSFSKANLNINYVGYTAILSSVNPENKVLIVLFNSQNY